MKLELLIRDFREAIRGCEELEPNALANLNSAIDTAERRIIRKPQSQSPMTESSDRNSGGNEETEMEVDVIANVKTAGEVIGDLSKTLANMIEFANGSKIKLPSDKLDSQKGYDPNNMTVDVQDDDLPVIAPNAPVSYVKNYCLDCGVELANDLFERCGRCLEARM
jgi:hypothetical protein